MMRWMVVGLLFLLAGCEPELRTIGTVEEDKLITPGMLDEMGYEAFREEYLGKEVTVTGFGEEGVGVYIGGYRPDKLQCEIAFSTRDDSVNKEFLITIFSNDHPDFVLKDLLKRQDDFNPDLLSYPDEVALPESICNRSCEYNQETGECFYKSPNLKITGKLFQIRGDEEFELNRLFMKVKGVAY